MRRCWRTTTWVVLASFVACAALRIGLVDRHGLWADELFSLAMATGHSLEHPAEAADPSRGDFVEYPDAVSPRAYADYLEHDTPPATPKRVLRAVLLSDTSPPLYYLSLYAWTLAAGTSDASLRLFSVAFALLAFPVVWSVARRTSGRTGAAVAAVLYSVAPVSVFYATEGRMYSLLWFLSACLLWLSIDLHEKRRAWTMLAWLAVAALGLLTHYFFVFVLCAAGVWLLLHPGRLNRAWLIATGIATAALILPWYIRLPESLGNWRVTADWLTWEPGEGYNRMLGTLLLPWQFLSPRGIWGVRAEADWVVGIAFAASVVLALWETRPWTWVEPRRQLLWITLAAACVGPLLFDLWRGTYVTAVPRYAIAAMPAAYALVGFILAELRWPNRSIVLAVMVLASMLGIRRMYLNDGRQSEPTRLAGRHLAQEAQPGDLVLVHSIPSGVAGIARYMEAAPEGVAYAGWIGQLRQRQVPQDIQRLGLGHQRIFVVLVHEVGDPAPEVDWLRHHAQLEGQYRFDTIRILRFASPTHGSRLPSTTPSRH